MNFKQLSLFLLPTAFCGALVALDVPYRNGSGAAGIAGEWLGNSPLNARIAALGNASVALKGADGAYANPASLAGLREGESTLSMGTLFSGGQLNFISGAYPLTLRNSGGISVIDLRSGEAERTNDFGESQGSFRDQNLAFVFSFARKVWDPVLSSGVNLKVLKQSFADYSATGYGADAGFIIKPFSSSLTLGLAIQNILPIELKLKEEVDKVPLIVKEGLAFNFNLFERTSRIVLETGQGVGIGKWAFGWEQNFEKDFPLVMRLGANTREYTFGFGFGKQTMSLDYSAIFHELGLLHRFGVSVRFSAVGLLAEKEIKAEWKRIEEKEVALVKREREITLEEKSSNSVVFLLAKAKNLYKNNKYEPCSNILDKILPNFTDNDDVLVLMAMTRAHIFMDKEDYLSAEKQLRTAVELDPEHEEALTLHARIKELLEVYADK